ncbi:MAG: DUF2975 domain-containing protein [Candidatus Pacebacteria bacterium]|nr:DUF2975 domain-containing protein [Candidatus Paceibacterota bacterium]
MKRGSTIFLRLALVVLGLMVLGLCIIMFVGLAGEGIRNMSYFDRLVSPLVLTIWFTAIPFYIALFQAWKLLNCIDKNIAFSEFSRETLKKIKYCAVTISVLYVASLPQFFILADADDAPGIVVIGLVFVGASFTVAVFVAILERLLQHAIDIKSENDLTV